MSEDVTDELRDDEDWDWEAAEVVPSNSGASAVVSVRLTADEFEVIAARGEAEGFGVTEFVRRAALTAAHRKSKVV